MEEYRKKQKQRWLNQNEPPKQIKKSENTSDDEKYAKELQQIYDQEFLQDQRIAKELQEKLDQEKRQTQLDEEIAKQLQKEFDSDNLIDLTNEDKELDLMIEDEDFTPNQRFSSFEGIHQPNFNPLMNFPNQRNQRNLFQNQIPNFNPFIPNYPQFQHPQQQNNNFNESYEELLNLQERIGNVPVGIDKETLENITSKFKLKKIPEDEKLCSICYDDFKINENVRKLPCMHLYHSHCIDKWLKNSKKCPLCQKEILE
jgi:hypothetical protein